MVQLLLQQRFSDNLRTFRTAAAAAAASTTSQLKETKSRWPQLFLLFLLLLPLLMSCTGRITSHSSSSSTLLDQSFDCLVEVLLLLLLPISTNVVVGSLVRALTDWLRGEHWREMSGENETVRQKLLFWRTCGQQVSTQKTQSQQITAYPTLLGGKRSSRKNSNLKNATKYKQLYLYIRAQTPFRKVTHWLSYLMSSGKKNIIFLNIKNHLRLNKNSSSSGRKKRTKTCQIN